LNSALYWGSVRHRRSSPVSHQFRFGLFMAYLDLDEIHEVFRDRWLWSADRPNLAWFRRADYFGDPARPIDVCVRDAVEASGLPRPTGPVRMLTHLRYLGYVQNPVTFYYCFGEDAVAPEAVLAEITNTPWGERHAYALPWGEDVLRERFPKAFHVSPFMPMDVEYSWHFTPPGDALTVHMENYRDGAQVFDATLSLRRREISASTLAGALFSYPWMSAKVALGIYTQATRLWLKRAPFHAHPDRSTS